MLQEITNMNSIYVSYKLQISSKNERIIILTNIIYTDYKLDNLFNSKGVKLILSCSEKNLQTLQRAPCIE